MSRCDPKIDLVGRNSGAAFTALVARYVHLVYSTGLRFSGNPQRAEEITQVAIIILASDFPGGRSATVQSAQFRSLSPDFSGPPGVGESFETFTAPAG